MLSKSASYAIQALTYLSMHNNERDFVPIAEIAETLSIPYHFLKKIIAELAQRGLLETHRSSRGGVALSKSAKKTTLLDIITYIDGEGLFTECIFGLPGCGEATPCPLHSSWTIERNRLRLLFSSTTIADLAKRAELKGYRISL